MNIMKLTILILPFFYARKKQYDINLIFRIKPVSKEVILRRLLMLGLTTKSYYLKKHREWKSKYKEPFGRKDKKTEIWYTLFIFHLYDFIRL